MQRDGRWISGAQIGAPVFECWDRPGRITAFGLPLLVGVDRIERDKQDFWAWNAPFFELSRRGHASGRKLVVVKFPQFFHDFRAVIIRPAAVYGMPGPIIRSIGTFVLKDDKVQTHVLSMMPLRVFSENLQYKVAVIKEDVRKA